MVSTSHESRYFYIQALSRQHEISQHWHNNAIELWEARATCRIPRHPRSRDRPQLRISRKLQVHLLKDRCGKRREGE